MQSSNGSEEPRSPEDQAFQDMVQLTEELGLYESRHEELHPLEERALKSHLKALGEE